MTKMQIGEYKGFDNTFSKVWDERKGFPLSRFTGGLFRGGSVCFLYSLTSDILEKPLHGGIMNMMQKAQTEPMTPHQICFGGALSGAVKGVLLNPLSVVSISWMIGTDACGVPYKGVIDTFRRSSCSSVLRRGMVPHMIYSGAFGAMTDDAAFESVVAACS